MLKYKIKYIWASILCLTLLVFVSCEDEDKNPFDVQLNESNLAPFTNIIPSTPVIDVTSLETNGFSGIVDAPANNVASWSVSFTRTSAGILSDTIALPSKTITNFPSEFNITGAEIAEALNITIDELFPSDNIEFIATSTGFDGRTLTFEDLNVELAGQPEQHQGYNFGAVISCEFIQSDIIGEYEVIEDEWGDYLPGDIITIIAGETDNTYRILADRNFFLFNASENVWIEVTVDPITGTSTALTNEDFMYDFGNFIVAANNGITLSCTGDITIELKFLFPGEIPEDLISGYNLVLDKID